MDEERYKTIKELEKLLKLVSETMEKAGYEFNFIAKEWQKRKETQNETTTNTKT